MKRATVAFATCSAYRDLAKDDLRARAAFEARNIEIAPLVWDEHPTDIDRFDAIVLRSCWDYHEKTPAFIEWLGELERHGVPLYNPPGIARWNLDKRYLDELADKGIRAPRTKWIDAGSTVSLGAVLERAGFSEAVVKPAIGMNGFDTWRVVPETAAENEERFAELVRSRTVMVQEFLPKILDEGELSLVFFGGRFSHAVRKRPSGGEFRIQEEYGGTRSTIVPSESLVREAERILGAVPSAEGAPPLLYARVDGIVDGSAIVVMELELIDPTLFLAYDDSAVHRFADAVASAIGSH
ncbi:MAG: hypothetical protein HOW73_02725 [Polyangiaceae bacterium]|nr:hypothetical protein [Polyangiaceae bacterium]